MVKNPVNRIEALSADQRAALLRRLRRPSDVGGDAYDVAVLGGGVAGLTAALHLQQDHPGLRILVVEKQCHPAPEAAHKVGESTVEIAAHYLRDTLGLKGHLENAQLRKFGLRMFFSDGANDDIARRVEIGPTDFPPLATYQLDRGRLENALAERVRAEGIELTDGSRVLAVALRPEEHHHRVRIRGTGGEREVRARWIVDASGRHQLLARQLGLRSGVAHAANAVWFRIAHPVDLTGWTGDPGWHARVPVGDRALSTNHLMGPGYWVWLIRLASGSTSVGIVTDAAQHSFDAMNRLDRALDWLHEHEPQCAAEIDRHAAKIQDFRVLKNYSYGCRQAYSGADRWCLTGEAAVFLDPLYSPGLDMIAIGNGLAVDLIGRDLRGDDTAGAAAVHDGLFLRLTRIWLAVYEGQYVLMGHPRIMISKIIWDTAFYWGVFGLLFFHGAFPALAESPSIAQGLTRYAELSNRVQAFFREWRDIDRAPVTEPFVDLYSPLEFMVELHDGMAAGLSRTELEARFSENLRLFEQLAGQLVEAVIEAHVEDPAAFDQIRRWQADPSTARLLAVHRRERRRRPTDDGWLVTGRPAPEMAAR